MAVDFCMRCFLISEPSRRRNVGVTHSEVIVEGSVPNQGRGNNDGAARSSERTPKTDIYWYVT